MTIERKVYSCSLPFRRESTSTIQNKIRNVIYLIIDCFKFWLKPIEILFSYSNGLKPISIEYLEQLTQYPETIIKDMFQFLSDEKAMGNFS